MLLLLLLLLLLRDESTNFVCRFSSPALAKYHIFTIQVFFKVPFFVCFCLCHFYHFYHFYQPPLDAKKELKKKEGKKYTFLCFFCRNVPYF